MWRIAQARGFDDLSSKSAMFLELSGQRPGSCRLITGDLQILDDGIERLRMFRQDVGDLCDDIVFFFIGYCMRELIRAERRLLLLVRCRSIEKVQLMMANEVL